MNLSGNIYLQGRPLRFLHLLLQFLADFDKTGCILFVIGQTTIPLFRILNFYLKTKWRPYDFQKSFKKYIFLVCILSGGAILAWDKNLKIWTVESYSIRLWRECNQFYQNRLKIVEEDAETVTVYPGYWPWPWPWPWDRKNFFGPFLAFIGSI